MKTVNKVAISSALACCALSVQAALVQPELVFNEDFARSNAAILGNGWLEIEESANDVKLQSGAVRLRDNAEGGIDAGIARQFGTGLSGLSLSFDWKPLLNSDPADKFLVSWATYSA